MSGFNLKNHVALRAAFVALAAAFLLSAPVLAFAQSSFDATCMVKGGCWGPLITCTWDYTNVAGPHSVPTCTSVCDFAVLVQTWIFFFYSIIVYILLPLGIAIGGFIWLTSAGSGERITMARGIFKKTFVGLLTATVVVLIVGTVISVIGTKSSNSSGVIGWPNIVCDANNNPLDVNLKNQ